MSISKLQSAFRASLESEEIKEEGFEDLGEIIEAEEEMIAAEEAIDEVEDNEEIIEGLDEVAEGLESICAYMEASLENGGLEPGEAAALNLAVEAHTRRLGLENSLMASMESFGGSSDRIAATQISMESIKETIKKIWQAIKNAVEKALRAIGDFFAKLFKGVDRLLARAEALKKDVEDLGGKKAEGKIKVPGANALHVGGKLDAATIVKGLDTLHSVMKSHIDNSAVAAETYYRAMAALANNKKQLEADEESAVQEAIEKAENAYVEISSKVKSRTAEMAGGVYLEQITESGASSTRVNPPTLKRTGKTADAGTEIDVPSQSDLKKIVDTTINILKLIKDKKKVTEDLRKARKEALDASKNFVDAADKGRLGKAWTQAKVNVVLRSANRDLARPVNQLASHGFSVSRAALALVARSVAAYR